MKHGVIVYRSRFVPELWTMDCEQHGYTRVSKYFFDAIGRAILHRKVVVR